MSDPNARHALPPSTAAVAEALNLAAVQALLSQPPRNTLLPVAKQIEVGPGGGLFYTNANGRRVYLKRRERALCQEGRDLVGSLGSCADLLGRW